MNNNFKNDSAYKTISEVAREIGLVNKKTGSIQTHTIRYWENEFSDESINLAGYAKKITGLPTISVGSVGLNKDFTKTFGGDHETQTADISILYEKLNNNEFDLIALGRILLSDPNWANKVKDGKESSIVPYNKSFAENYV